MRRGARDGLEIEGVVGKERETGGVAAAEVSLEFNPWRLIDALVSEANKKGENMARNKSSSTWKVMIWVLTRETDVEGIKS